MKLLLTGSEERACSFFSGDAGMAEAYPVSLVVPSVRSEIARVDQIDQIDETAEIGQTDQIDETDEIDSLFTLSPCPSALDSGL